MDNGYHNWSTTVPPFKATTSRKEIRFSEWLESMRKDVECTFGILKGRWRILKTGIRVHGLNEADQIWKTCCALHNWLLEVDGLDDKWMDGIPSDWEEEAGLHDNIDIRRVNALERLNNPSLARNFDSSGMGRGCDRDEDSNELPEVVVDSVETVQQGSVNVTRKISLPVFRAKLVRHFDIAFNKREIKWPSRIRRQQPQI